MTDNTAGERAQAKITELEMLQSGWDGYPNSVPINRVCIEVARVMATEPSIVPAAMAFNLSGIGWAGTSRSTFIRMEQWRLHMRALLREWMICDAAKLLMSLMKDSEAGKPLVVWGVKMWCDEKRQELTRFETCA